MKKRIYDPKVRRQRYLKNRERELAGRKAYYQKNRQKAREYGSRYYQEHREETIARAIENRKKRLKKLGGKK